MRWPLRKSTLSVAVAALAALALVRGAGAAELAATRNADGSLCVPLAGERATTTLVLVRLSVKGAAALGKGTGANDLALALADPESAVEAIGQGVMEHCGKTAGVEPFALAGFALDQRHVTFLGSTVSTTAGPVTVIGTPLHVPTPKWGVGKMPIGVNVDIPGRGDTSFPFKDLMIQADFWQYIDVGANAGKLVPEATAAVPVYGAYNDPKWQMPNFAAFNSTYSECAAILTAVTSAAVPSGTYVITWDGQHASGPALSAFQMGYLANGGPLNGVFAPYAQFQQVSPNRIELTLRNDGEPIGPGENAYHGSILLKVKSSSAANPVRNVRAWLPGMEGAAPADMITPWMVASCRPAACIRFLNWIEHWNKPSPFNSPPAALTPWATRNYPGAPFQTRRDRVAIEHMAELARKASAHLWIPFHLGVLADDGGSGGGRARVMGSIRLLHEGLHPGARISVELGNELWNAGFFTVQAAAIDRLRTGAVRLDGSAGPEWSDTDPSVQVFGTYAAMVRCMSILWEWCREELGTDVSSGRVVRVFCGGINSYDTIVSGARAIDGLDDVAPLDWAPSVPVHVSYGAAGRIMIDDIDALAAGGYMGVTGNHVVPSMGQTLNALGAAATPQHVLETMQSRRLLRLPFDIEWKDGAALHRRPYLNYESGQHVVDAGAAWNAANNLAQTGGDGATAPLSMEGEYAANLNQLRAASPSGSPGASLSLQYTLRSRQTNVPSGTWGLANDFLSTGAESPKLRALRRWAAQP